MIYCCQAKLAPTLAQEKTCLSEDIHLHTNLHCHLLKVVITNLTTRWNSQYPKLLLSSQSTLGPHNTTIQKKGHDLAYYPLNTALWSSPTMKLPSIGSLDSTSWIHWQLWFSQPFVAAFVSFSPCAASSLKSHQNCVRRLTH